jgi:dTDP-4-amino-4,6-dideoxygalactose transaminase
MAKIAETQFPIGVSSGPAGCHVAVDPAGIREGDLFITAPFSLEASENCILLAKTVPIFVDVLDHSRCIDPDLVNEAVDTILKGLDFIRENIR